MKSTTESERWLRDAEACLTSAERALEAKDFRVVVQNAQLCVAEGSAKAIIAHLAEPLWRHDPSPQLRRLLKAHEKVIIERCGEEMPMALRQLAEDAEKAAPWPCPEPAEGTVGPPMAARASRDGWRRLTFVRRKTPKTYSNAPVERCLWRSALLRNGAPRSNAPTTTGSVVTHPP